MNSEIALTKPRIVANRGMRACVEQKVNFINTNDTAAGSWKKAWLTLNEQASPDHWLYVVTSYGSPWPLIVYDSREDVWIVNTEKVSMTTTRHLSQARPYTVKAIEVNHDLAVRASMYGYVGMVKYRLKRAA